MKGWRSQRNLEETMPERRLSVGHSTVCRWALKLLPVLEKRFRWHKRPVGKSRRMDETYIKINGQSRYLYRVVDKDGDTVDSMLRAHRDKVAARRYFEKASGTTASPGTVTVDKSRANRAALEDINAAREQPIKVRQTKYLNNIVEQDHRAIKRRMRPMMGFKNLRCARILLCGIEWMPMIAKGQMHTDGLNQSCGLGERANGTRGRRVPLRAYIARLTSSGSTGPIASVSRLA